MGAVYEVEHSLTHHRRALKLLHAEMAATPGVVERFLREASAAGRIGNRHIVETFDAGHLESGEPYIVMELLEGKTLAETLDQDGALSVDRSCELLAQAADGISAAHAAGIVHRDLKPENIFIVSSDPSFVKILDFGVSKFDAASTGVSNFTQEGSQIGTPYYMSPEQVRGERSVDARADVYALGVLLYECLTGSKPFMAESLPHLAVLIHEGMYTPPSVLRPGLPAAVDVIVARAMASDPGARTPNAEQFASQLQQLRNSLGPLALDQTQPGPLEPPPEALPARTLTPSPVSRAALPAHKPRRSAVPMALFGLAALIATGVLLFNRGAEREPETTAEPPNRRSPGMVHGSTRDSATAIPEPVSVVPMLNPLPTASESALPPPSASVPPRTQQAPPRERPGAPSRSRAHGLSEENPFR